MPKLVQCPSCQGLLVEGRESCPHCDYRPSLMSGRQVALGAAVAAGFAVLACGSRGPPASALYGACVCQEPDSGYVRPDAGDAGHDAGPDAGDAG